MKKYLLSVFIMIAIVAVIVTLKTSSIFAAPAPTTSTPVPLIDWAWSSNIGWIKFNARSGEMLSNVNLATSSSQPTIGHLNGYAWSSNIGWIKFGGLNGFPAGGDCTTDCNARVDLSSGKVTGWARACSGSVKSGNPNTPGDCSSSQPRTDGWDGWIELSGNNHLSPNTTGNGGVTLGVDSTDAATYGKFMGYAWGGAVVGWMNFNPAFLTGGVPTNGSGIVPPVSCIGCGGGGGSATPPITGSCTISPTTVNTGGTVDANANIINTGHVLPYTYSWNVYDGSTLKYTEISSNNPYTTKPLVNMTNNDKSYSIKVSVTDSSTPSHSTSAAITCNPSVTVNKLAPGLKLFLDAPSVANGNGNVKAVDNIVPTLTVKKGTVVNAGLNIDKNEYDRGCIPSPNSDWGSVYSGNVDSLINNMRLNSDQGYLLDKTNTTGSFNLGVVCRKTLTSGGTQSDTRAAKLQIYSTSINER